MKNTLCATLIFVLFAITSASTMHPANTLEQSNPAPLPKSLGLKKNPKAIHRVSALLNDDQPPSPDQPSSPEQNNKKNSSKKKRRKIQQKEEKARAEEKALAEEEKLKFLAISKQKKELNVEQQANYLLNKVFGDNGSQPTSSQKQAQSDSSSPEGLALSPENEEEIRKLKEDCATFKKKITNELIDIGRQLHDAANAYTSYPTPKGKKTILSLKEELEKLKAMNGPLVNEKSYAALMRKAEKALSTPLAPTSPDGQSLIRAQDIKTQSTGLGKPVSTLASESTLSPEKDTNLQSIISSANKIVEPQPQPEPEQTTPSMSSIDQNLPPTHPALPAAFFDHREEREKEMSRLVERTLGVLSIEAKLDLNDPDTLTLLARFINDAPQKEGESEYIRVLRLCHDWVKNEFNTRIWENTPAEKKTEIRLARQKQRQLLEKQQLQEQKRQQDAEEKENKSAQLVIAMQQLEAEPKNSPRHAIYFEKFRTLFYGNYKLVGTDVEEHTSLLNSLVRKYRLEHNAWKPERVKQSSATYRTLPKPRKNKSGQGSNGNPPVGRSKGTPKTTIQKQVLKAMIEKTAPKKPKPERLPSEPPMTPAQRKLWSRDVEQLAPPVPAPSPLISEPKAPGEDETKEFAALNAQESAPIVTKSYSIPYGDGSIKRKRHAEKHHCPNDPRYEKLDPKYKHPNGCYDIDGTTLYPCHLSKAQLLENIGYAIRHGTPYIDSDLRTKILGQFPPNDTGHPIYILAVTEQNPMTGQNKILTDFSISKRTHTRKSLESQNVHEQHERGLLAKTWQQEKQRKRELRLATLQEQKELRLEAQRQEKLHRAVLQQLQHEPQAPLPAQEETFQPWVRGVGPQGNLPPLDFQHWA